MSLDAIRHNIKLVAERSSIPDDMDIEPGRYFLATAHRQENVDDWVRFTGILKGLECVAEEFEMPVISRYIPVKKKRIREFVISTNGNIGLIDTVDFMSFLHLENNASLVLTDSGGVQEETCILGVPSQLLTYSV